MPCDIVVGGMILLHYGLSHASKHLSVALFSHELKNYLLKRRLLGIWNLIAEQSIMTLDDKNYL